MEEKGERKKDVLRCWFKDFSVSLGCKYGLRRHWLNGIIDIISKSRIFFIYVWFMEHIYDQVKARWESDIKVRNARRPILSLFLTHFILIQVHFSLMGRKKKRELLSPRFSFPFSSLSLPLFRCAHPSGGPECMCHTFVNSWKEIERGKIHHQGRKKRWEYSYWRVVSYSVSKQASNLSWEEHKREKAWIAH